MNPSLHVWIYQSCAEDVIIYVVFVNSLLNNSDISVHFASLRMFLSTELQQQSGRSLKSSDVSHLSTLNIKRRRVEETPERAKLLHSTCIGSSLLTSHP